jgi:predicted aconitase
MELTATERHMLQGEFGRSTRKAMEILVALGTIYQAEKMIPVSSVQVSGVSYDNLGEAGLEFLSEMAAGGGKARVLTTLNPAGMDIEDRTSLGIGEEFARQQERVIDAFGRMGIVTTCTCTPYLTGNLPHYGEHIAWAESSAVCYANSVVGARTNREGGPSALAAALTGRTPAYGLHLSEQRRPSLTVCVKAPVDGNRDFGALGLLIGRQIEQRKQNKVVYIQGIEHASLENLKSFCASLATYGGAALFHMENITPEASLYKPPAEAVDLGKADIEAAAQSLNDDSAGQVDFVSLGCPHLSILEIARIAELLQGKRVKKTFWITTARPTRQIADRMGYTAIIEAAGAVIAADTCCVVAPIRGRFHTIATDSAKACYYAYGKNKIKTRFMPFEEVILEALR